MLMHSPVQGNIFVLSSKQIEMKTLFAHPIAIYVIAGITSLCIMTVIDYLLGPVAEHLNAWVILNRVFGNDPGLVDSIVLRKLGLPGAVIVLLLVNSALGGILILLLKGVLKLFNA